MKEIWIKNGLFTKRIKNVETWDIMNTIDIGGTTYPTHPRFVVKHSDGGVSVVPVPRLMDKTWGIKCSTETARTPTQQS